MSVSQDQTTQLTGSAPVHDQAREREHRAAANRAVTVSAIGLAVTGIIELAVALLTGSVALLGDGTGCPPPTGRADH